MRLITGSCATLLMMGGFLHCAAPAGAQSLGEVARKEAERRKALADVQGKAIHMDSVRAAPDPPPSGSRKVVAREAANRPDDRLRNEVRKLDRQIRQQEDRLTMLRRQAEAARSAPPRTGRNPRRGIAEPDYDKLRREIEGMELTLKRLRNERLDAYNSARRAGFLPGEIDGKGIIP